MVLIVSLCGCDFNTKQLEYIAEEFIGLFSREKTIVEEYYVFPPEYNAAYNSLSNKQKQIYRKIYAISEQMPEGYVAVSKQYEDVIRDISLSYTAVLYDHPEIFWMPSTYIIGEQNTGFSKEILLSFNYQISGSTTKYSVTKTKRDEMRKELENKVNSIISAISENDGEFEKEKIINDYICQNTEYVKQGEWVDTAYGCLINNKALCEGYSKAFKLLCNEVGIECDLIVGHAGGEGHMWNSVNIDNKHSFVDVTWNDNPDFPYLYFNITTEQISYDHTFMPLFSEMEEDSVIKGNSFNFVERVCEFKGNTYYDKYGFALDDFDASNYSTVAAEIINNTEIGDKKSVQLLLSSNELKKEFENNPEKFLIKIQRHLRNLVITAYAFERDVLVIYFE